MGTFDEHKQRAEDLHTEGGHSVAGRHVKVAEEAARAWCAKMFSGGFRRHPSEFPRLEPRLIYSDHIDMPAGSFLGLLVELEEARAEVCRLQDVIRHHCVAQAGTAVVELTKSTVANKVTDFITKQSDKLAGDPRTEEAVKTLGRVVRNLWREVWRDDF